MDSLTQFSLGAAIAAVCLGKKLGPRKAALLGGVLGSVPDLDVFLPFDNPVDSFVFHRGWTHSVSVHALATPLFGELLTRTFAALREHRLRVWTTVFLIFTTHAVIDAMTVYGTRLFWPLYPDPVGVGSIFIIDPLYSLPLLFVVVWAFARRDWSVRLGRGLAAALLVSSGYMALGVVLQAQAESRAKAVFAEAGIEAQEVFAIAAPFTTVVWKVIGREEDRYHNLYLSLFDDDDQARIYTHPRRADLAACLEGNDAFAKLQWFSRGYYRTDLEAGKLIVSDLRMGLTPYYVFRFAVAERNGDGVVWTDPVHLARQIGTLDQDLDWLGERIMGRPFVRVAEPVEAVSPGPADAMACS